MTKTAKGYLAGVASAVSYGLNPLGALYMYADGMRPPSVLFYRFSFAAILLALLMVAERKSFALTKKRIWRAGRAGTAVQRVVNHLLHQFSIHRRGHRLHLSSSSIPVMVAVLMAVFFKERLTPRRRALHRARTGGHPAATTKGDGNAYASRPWA